MAGNHGEALHTSVRAMRKCRWFRFASQSKLALTWCLDRESHIQVKPYLPLSPTNANLSLLLIQ